MVAGVGVVKRYDDFTAVDGVDFAVERGECFGFLGPNGAGKTSLLKVIQRLSPLTAGAVVVDGMAAGVDDARIKAILGVAPQEDALDPDLNIEKNLVVYARYFGVARKEAIRRAGALLSFFHLDRRHDGQVRDLSGGMRRRLVIARALINEPKIIILDEPTTGLDPAARRVIWGRLEELKERGVTMLLTTHYMDEAARLCDRIAIMARGKILVTGRPRDLVAEAVGQRVTEFRVARGAEERLRRRLVDTGVPHEEAGGMFYLFVPDAEAVAAVGETPVRGLLGRDASLEDLFLKLTGHGLSDGV
jgi:lipooligosaccharide transport system ATP-binding protein